MFVVHLGRGKRGWLLSPHLDTGLLGEIFGMTQPNWKGNSTTTTGVSMLPVLHTKPGVFMFWGDMERAVLWYSSCFGVLWKSLERFHPSTSWGVDQSSPISNKGRKKEGRKGGRKSVSTPCLQCARHWAGHFHGQLDSQQCWKVGSCSVFRRKGFKVAQGVATVLSSYWNRHENCVSAASQSSWGSFATVYYSGQCSENCIITKKERALETILVSSLISHIRNWKPEKLPES